MQGKSEKPYIIGISGNSGSGKTFFLNCFLQHFKKGEVGLISQDDYYLPVNTKSQEENRNYNFDLPTAFDLDQFHKDLLQLIEGENVYKKEYTFNNPNLTPKVLEITAAPILIVEGLFIFHSKKINDLLNHRIFIHADESIALERRIKRDATERGYSEEDVIYKWENHVLPAFRNYSLPYKTSCNQIIENNSKDPKEIAAIAQDLSAYLRKAFFNP